MTAPTPTHEATAGGTGLRRRELAIVATAVVVTLIAGWMTIGPGPSAASFAVSALALAMLAWLVSFATEQLGERMGPEGTGLLQSTLGNLPEFFVVLFALREGQTLVATTSIIGSIFANALLVLGITIVVGAMRAPGGVMKFGARLPSDTATLLLLAVFLIVSIGIATTSQDRAADDANAISIVGAIAMLVVYAMWVRSYVFGGAKGDPSHGAPRVGLVMTLGLLALAGAGAAFVSEWFVEGLQPAIDALGISAAFAGLVIVAIAGNAIENATAVVLAAKGQHDLAISVVKNSVAQIAVFLFPLLVLVSQLFDDPLTFSMAPIWIGALALTAIIVWQVTGDGQAAAWEGAALIAFYVILATIALYE
ncbi:MAG: sodium:proton exchanger [Thermoleophilia bacterium]|nr:sodium:proton exchanger [Thermoleophilia bacterium]